MFDALIYISPDKDMNLSKIVFIMSGLLTESITPLCDDLSNPSPSSKLIDGEKVIRVTLFPLSFAK